ncbi:hypothetical protein [Phaeobacter piscinae]|uniref:hypothetical protein n=1 Tax=Phaeobacter piscinae TaxID=1580596 RepID=UPI0011AB54D1|nr:hypothetical protein [Phaeobacter piscinae]
MTESSHWRNRSEIALCCASVVSDLAAAKIRSRFTFDEDLWPEYKEPVSALKVAALLGINVEQELCLRELPFAWPGLGEHTSSTVEYTEMMLKAYASQRADKSTE